MTKVQKVRIGNKQCDIGNTGTKWQELHNGDRKHVDGKLRRHDK